MFEANGADIFGEFTLDIPAETVPGASKENELLLNRMWLISH